MPQFNDLVPDTLKGNNYFIICPNAHIHALMLPSAGWFVKYVVRVFPSCSTSIKVVHVEIKNKLK